MEWREFFRHSLGVNRFLERGKNLMSWISNKKGKSLEGKVLAVIQARMSSKRLPGKVLADVEGKPMILRQLARVKEATAIDELVVATSTHHSDDVLADVLGREGIEVFRGELDDVASRFLVLVKSLGPTHVVRLTADCPLADPRLIDSVVRSHLEKRASYTANTLLRTFPKGLDVEIFRASDFEYLCSLGLTPEESEHVTLGFHKRPQEFTLQNLVQDGNFSGHRWTVDYPSDLEFVRSVYRHFAACQYRFTSEEVLKAGLVNSG